MALIKKGRNSLLKGITPSAKHNIANLPTEAMRNDFSQLQKFLNQVSMEDPKFFLWMGAMPYLVTYIIAQYNRSHYEEYKFYNEAWSVLNSTLIKCVRGIEKDHCYNRDFLTFAKDEARAIYEEQAQHILMLDLTARNFIYKYNQGIELKEVVFFSNALVIQQLAKLYDMMDIAVKAEVKKRGFDLQNSCMQLQRMRPYFAGVDFAMKSINLPADPSVYPNFSIGLNTFRDAIFSTQFKINKQF